MNDQLFYDPDFDVNSKTIILNETESHHIAKVLRLQTGQNIKILNGRGLVAEAEISSISKKEVSLKILSTEVVPENYSKIHLAFSPVKKRDKNEWIIEKATELGVSEISFFKSNHSERTEINLDRVEKICISSIKQSQNPFLPKFSEITKLKRLIDFTSDTYTAKFIAYCNTTQSDHIANKIVDPKSILILIGPEGGFAREEIKIAKDKGFRVASLGDLTLRSETAAIAALAAIQFYRGWLGG